MTTAVSSLAYVYAVTWSGARLPRELDVDLVEHGELAAVVRPAGNDDVRARRRDLLAHAELVQRVFDRTPVVPLRFGAVVADPVADVLEPRHDELTRLLRRLEGHVEVTLRAFYREEEILRSLLAEHPRLARLRSTAPPVQVGEAVLDALRARREADADAIVSHVARRARDVVVEERRTELEVVRAAFLVEGRSLTKVDRVVEGLARERGGTTLFKYTGPLPPHHFAALDPQLNGER